MIFMVGMIGAAAMWVYLHINSPKEDRVTLVGFKVHLVVSRLDKPGVREAADQLYDGLTTAGVAVLFDDRDETPGVKFNDADLLGIPLRATVSPRNLEKGSVEVRPRRTSSSRWTRRCKTLSPALRRTRPGGQSTGFRRSIDGFWGWFCIWCLVEILWLYLAFDCGGCDFSFQGWLQIQDGSGWGRFG